MPDKFPKRVRSKIMSAIHSKWTSAEKKIHNQLKNQKVRHAMHPKLLGSPDVLLKDFGAVIFIDGCFWHNCPKHGHIPKSNLKYWKPKILRTIRRDLKNKKLLNAAGFKVLRVWEHDVVKNNFNAAKLLHRIRKQV